MYNKCTVLGWEDKRENKGWKERQKGGGVRKVREVGDGENKGGQ